LASEGDFYKRYKEEMVTGFSGAQDWYIGYTFMQASALAVFLHKFIVTFVRQRSTWFDQMRTDPISTYPKLIFNSILDTIFATFSLCIFLYYCDHLWTINVIILLMILTIYVLDKLTGDPKKPIFFNYFSLPHSLPN